jgi:hypothetical protein
MTNPEFGHNPEQEKPMAPLEKEESKLEDRFSQIEDRDFVLMPGEFGEILKPGELRPNKATFLAEVEALYRHAFAIKSDKIIFSDKAARPFGLLGQKIAPIIRAEYCRLNKKNIAAVPIPQVLFINPARHRDIYMDKKMNLHKNQDLEPDKYLLKTIVKNTRPVLLFDESTDGHTEHNLELINKSPEEQYSTYSSIDWNNEDNRSHYQGRSQSALRYYFENVVKPSEPFTKFQTHIGASETRSGNLPLWTYVPKEILYGVEEGSPGDTFVKPIDIRQKEANEDVQEVLKKLGLKDIKEIQERFRHELDMIAKESWRKYKQKFLKI